MPDFDDARTLHDLAFRRAVALVAAANLAYFFVEFFVARHIGSVSLLADSIDFLEDTALNLLILLAIRRSPQTRARIGMLLAVILLVPTAATLWTAWQKFLAPVPPEPWLLSTTGFGAFLVNFGCVALLLKYRHRHGSLTRAAFLSARNDVWANAAIIAAALVTLRWLSGWPDLIVGLGIAAINSDAALKVWRAARRESVSLTQSK
ncbi:MAG: cation transporter [Acidobacteriota bacterium]